MDNLIKTRLDIQSVDANSTKTINVKCYDVTFRFIGTGSALIKNQYPCDQFNPLRISCDSGQIYEDSFQIVTSGSGYLLVLSRIDK